jgi:hypothetical protein
MGITEARKRINDVQSRNLRFLDLSLLQLTDNDLIELLPDIGKLSNLSNLDLSNNSLTTIPEAIGGIENLVRLNLSKNPFTALPESIGYLKNLTRLDLSDTAVISLPESIGGLLKLIQLHVSGDSLETLPESIYHLPNFTWLKVSGGNIEVLPECILHLPYLEDLIVSGNNFKVLPEFKEDSLSRLDYLSVSGDDFKFIPVSIGNLTNLSVLMIEGNSFEFLPKEIKGLVNLTSLSISGNSFRNLPEEISELPKLVSLVLSDTAIRDVPESLGRLQGLDFLSFSNSPLSYEARTWLDRTFQGRAVTNMAAHSDNQSVEEVLEVLYKDKDERVSTMESLENCGLDPGIIYYGGSSVGRTKPAIEIIKEFMGNVGIHSKYELDKYGPPLRSLLDSVLNQGLFPKEERTLAMTKMIAYMGDCPTPIREGLTQLGVQLLLEQDTELSEINQNIIEREAVSKRVSKLKGFVENEKIEQVNGLLNCIYCEGAEKDSCNPNVRIIGERARLRSTTPYRGFAFLQIQNNPELIKNFACVVCQTDDNNEPIQADGMYRLDAEKIKNIKADYIAELGFGTSKQQEQKIYLNKYQEAMNELLQQYEELYTEYFNDAKHLLDIPSHTKELKKLLAKNGIVVKDEYEKYFTKKQSEIETFLDNKKNPKASLDKFTTPLNERKNPQSDSPDLSGGNQTKAIRSTPRL